MILAALLLATLPAIAAPHDSKFAKKIADELRSDRLLIQSIRHQYESDVHFVETEEAYHEALSDLEDYQSGDPKITRERLANDAQEVWFDLAPYRDTYGVSR